MSQPVCVSQYAWLKSAGGQLLDLTVNMKEMTLSTAGLSQLSLHCFVREYWEYSWSNKFTLPDKKVADVAQPGG